MIFRGFVTSLSKKDAINMIKIIKGIVLGVILTCLAAVLYVSTQHGKELLGNSLAKMGISAPTAPNYSTIINAISAISEYNSLKISANCRIRLENDALFKIGDWAPLPGRYLLYDIPITVKLGINFQDYFDMDTTRTDSIIITFPPIKILSTEQNLREAYIHERDGVLRKVNLDLHRRLMADQIGRFQDSIINDPNNIRKAKLATEEGFKVLFGMHPSIPPLGFRWKDELDRNKEVLKIVPSGESGNSF